MIYMFLIKSNFIENNISINSFIIIQIYIYIIYILIEHTYVYYILND